MARIFTTAELEQLESLDTQHLGDLQKDLIGRVRLACASELAGLEEYPEVSGDRRILRFLRGHKFSVDDASKYYSDMLNWRKAVGIDRIRNSLLADNLAPPQFPHYSTVQQLLTSVWHKNDKNGRPILIERTGKLLIREIVNDLPHQDYLDYMYHEWEYNQLVLDRLSRERGSLVRFCSIRDLEGLGTHLLWRPGLSFLRQHINMLQNNYPELVEKVFIINAPWVFSMVWKAIKPLLSERTIKKIVILDKNYRAELLNHIEAENLPELFGGSCSCAGGCMTPSLPAHVPLCTAFAQVSREDAGISVGER